MRRLLVAAVLLGLAATPAAADRSAADRAYGNLLSKYVNARGVRYDAWRADGADLKTISEVVTTYRSVDAKALDPADREALYINLYNAKVMEIVLLSNPRSSIRDLSHGMAGGEIFSRPVFNLGGKGLSLNDLEKKLRDEAKDPRVHFALNCAARSCPPIRAEPYAGSKLDAQLDDAAVRFLGTPGMVEVASHGGRTTVTTSRLFDWYAADFEAGGGAIEFIRKHAPPQVAEAIGADRPRLEFQEYDWSLNEAK